MKIEKSIVISDLHIPFEDKKVVSLVYDFIKEQEPDNIFINGDLLDCQAISKFPVRSDRYVSLKHEIEQVRGVLGHIRTLSPSANIVWIFGNHEYRFSDYLTKVAREFFGLVTLASLTECEKYNVKVVDSGQRESYYQYGKLLIGHFDKIKKLGGQTAISLLGDKGMSLITGHTHKVGSTIKRTIDGKFLGSWEQGCLCDLNPGYVVSPDWCQGFCVVYKEGDQFQVVQVPIINNKFYFGGKQYK